MLAIQVDDKGVNVLSWDRYVVLRLHCMRCVCNCGKKVHQTLGYFHTNFFKNFQKQSHIQTAGFYFPVKINVFGLTIHVYCAFLDKLQKMWDVYHTLVMPTTYTTGWLKSLWQTRDVSPFAWSWSFILQKSIQFPSRYPGITIGGWIPVEHLLFACCYYYLIPQVIL